MFGSVRKKELKNLKSVLDKHEFLEVEVYESMRYQAVKAKQAMPCLEKLSQYGVYDCLGIGRGDVDFKSVTRDELDSIFQERVEQAKKEIDEKITEQQMSFQRGESAAEKLKFNFCLTPDDMKYRQALLDAHKEILNLRERFKIYRDSLKRRHLEISRERI